mmetsp:Transcript_127466/g.396801  ORF Transcript_127466/g.396801 Transcript_127466/m.396801 type:complete len:458 (+) Transcript_127466:56-1429(+)
MGKLGSIAPAAASALLFSLAELAEASTARTAQLLAAAVLLAALAALHTHAVLGKGLSGWRLIQPFHGGPCFVVLQASGWTCLGLVGLAAFLVLLRAVHVPGLNLTLGVAQLAAQVVLVLSLAYFENVYVGMNFMTRQIKLWIMEGVPLAIVAVDLLLVMVGGIGVALLAPPSRRTAGWALLVLSLLAQAVGIRMMWTLTWNVGTICAYLLEYEEVLAVMACTGVGFICAPWYVGRTVFWKYDFPGRAIIGLSTWLSDEAMAPWGKSGWYLHDFCLGWIRVSFAQMDTALHFVPAVMLLQHCAWTIRPIHVVYSCLLTMLWGFTLSLRYIVIDWEVFWEGRLMWKHWGCSSLYEPHKIGHIYQFENRIVPQDDAFLKCCPGFLLIMGLSSAAMAALTTFPWAGELFFTLGCGYLFSIKSMALVIVGLIAGGLAVALAGVARMALRMRAGRPGSKARSE